MIFQSGALDTEVRGNPIDLDPGIDGNKPVFPFGRFLEPKSDTECFRGFHVFRF